MTEVQMVINIITVVISALTLLGVGVVFRQFWEDKHNKKKEKTEEAQQRAKELRQQEIREVYREENRIVEERINKLDEKVGAIADSLGKVEQSCQDTLRDCILDRYYDCRKKGYRNTYDTENIFHLYNDYRKLNGNSFVEDVIKKFKNLPSKEEIESLDTKGEK